ncbi:MAG TPA: GtrA family protein [Candidatus Paceibacterota bacterium]
MLKVDAYRVLRFVPVGVCAGVVDTLVVTAVLYAYGRPAAVWAALAGVVAGYPLSFFCHRHITFGAGRSPLYAHLIKFALLKMPNIAVRLLAALAVIAEHDWGVAVLVLIPVWNFGMKRWIFTGRAPWQKAA